MAIGPRPRSSCRSSKTNCAASPARASHGQTIQPTALVHEAYLKLVGARDPGWNGQAHFFGAAARAMREIVVDAARRRAAVKRGGDRSREALRDVAEPTVTIDMSDAELIALDTALRAFQAEHARAGEVVLLRQFAGLANETIAEVLGVTSRTVERDWQFAKAWLSRAMHS